MPFELRGSGHGKRTVLIGGSLLLVLAFCAASLIISFTRSDKMSKGWEEVHFICQKTQERFMVKYQDLPRDHLEKSAQGQLVFLDCPKCGGKDCAAPAIRCPDPKCGKYYPKYYRDTAGKITANRKCPFCGTIPHKWDRKHKGR